MIDFLDLLERQRKIKNEIDDNGKRIRDVKLDIEKQKWKLDRLLNEKQRLKDSYNEIRRCIREYLMEEEDVEPEHGESVFGTPIDS